MTGVQFSAPAQYDTRPLLRVEKDSLGVTSLSHSSSANRRRTAGRHQLLFQTNAECRGALVNIMQANTGMLITESFAMWPGSSLSGLYFARGIAIFQPSARSTAIRSPTIM